MRESLFYAEIANFAVKRKDNCMTLLRKYLRALLLAAVLVVSFVVTTGGAAAQTAADGTQLKELTAADSLFARFRLAARFDYDFPREKVYLHLDNNAYLEGETIWFKAYVVRASSLCPTTLSRVLYAELLDDAGRVVVRHILPVDSLGQADGSFSLALPVRAGYYEVRAYTREMTNWGTDACFSRVVPVFPADAIEKGSLNVPVSEPQKKTSRTYPRPNAVNERERVRLDFFPEGGRHACGVGQRIAYRMTDGTGMPIVDTLRLYTADGRLLAATESEHEGFGTFLLPADADGVYAMVGTKRFEVPEADPDLYYALTADVAAAGCGAALTIAAAPAATNGLMGLGVFCREQATYFDTLHVGAGTALDVALPPAAFREGVHRIVLFTPDGRAVAERLVWQPVRRAVNVSVRQNRETYDAFTPVALEMTLADTAARPVSATFSLAVRDAGGELVRDAAATAAADLLLASEVRGYVHNPAFYFEAADAAHRRAVDLLLLVQGWKAETFETLSRREAFTVSQPIEEHLTLNGTLYAENDRHRPLPHTLLKIRMYNTFGDVMKADAWTDDDGRFAFEAAHDYEGEWLAQFSLYNDNDKRRWGRVGIDRWFMPEPRPLLAPELLLEAPQNTAAARRRLTRSETFEWTDTIPRLVNTTLGEAVVRRRREHGIGASGNRYNYNGGERLGMRHANVFYNVALEVQRTRDAGDDVGYLYEFLSKLDKNVSYHISSPSDTPTSSAADTGRNVGMSYNSSATASGTESLNGIPESDGHMYLVYRNREPAIFANNSKATQETFSTRLADDIRSVAIVRSDQIKTAINAEDLGDRWNAFIYEEPDRQRYLEKKGVVKRRVQGFSVSAPFSAPSYNGIDLPTDEDVRRTLYWNPSVTADAAGRASAVFYSNAYGSDAICISVRGVTPDGRIIDFDR